MSLFVKETKFYRNFFSLMSVMVVQNIITTSVALADNVMLGNYSEQALSGVALANQIQFILNMIVIGVGEGIVVLSSQYWGKKDLESVKKIINCAIRVTLTISLFATVFIYFFPHFTLSLFTDDEAVITEGVKYLKIIIFN